MPVYDYKCKKCNNIIEVSHSMKDSPEILCEECGAKMEIRIGASAVVIKSETAANAKWRN